jgi:D-sedoheptulose 7-phosphate isomerase
MKNTIINELKSHQETINTVLSNSDIQNNILTASQLCVDALKNGNKILLCGNGGSAGDAQHISAELTGRYKCERRSLPAIALTTDTSALTAIGNDYGYERVFDRQLEGLANSGDVVIGISTSGNSQNIINAFIKAKEKSCICIGLTGRDGGAMNDNCDVIVIVPSYNTPRIQEMHILIVNTICQIIDDEFCEI